MISQFFGSSIKKICLIIHIMTRFIGDSEYHYHIIHTVTKKRVQTLLNLIMILVY